jgi:hypothetical protein
MLKIQNTKLQKVLIFDINFLKVSAEFLGKLSLGYTAKVSFVSLNGFDEVSFIIANQKL